MVSSAYCGLERKVIHFAVLNQGKDGKVRDWIWPWLNHNVL